MSSRQVFDAVAGGAAPTATPQDMRAAAETSEQPSESGTLAGRIKTELGVRRRIGL